MSNGWIVLYQNSSIWLAQQRLTGEQYRVLFALFSRLDFDNYLRVSLKEIAELLNMQPVSVSRAMKKLKELKIIIESSPAGKFKTYRLNPYIAYKGTVRTHSFGDFNSVMDKSK